MTPDLRFAKTDTGHEEIRTRTHRLNPKLRSLLVVVDGIKSAGELLQAAMALGSNRAALDTLIQDGFIAVAPAGSAVAPPAPASPAAVAPVADHAAPQVDPEKLRAAKVAMRQYIKLASGVMAAKSLHKLVDDVRSATDLAACLDRLCSEFEGNGFGEAAQNLRAQVDPLLG
jgi:hypothetical protein